MQHRIVALIAPTDVLAWPFVFIQDYDLAIPLRPARIHGVDAGGVEEVKCSLGSHDFDLVADLPKRVVKLRRANRCHRPGDAQKDFHVRFSMASEEPRTQ